MSFIWCYTPHPFISKKIFGVVFEYLLQLPWSRLFLGIISFSRFFINQMISVSFPVFQSLGDLFLTNTCFSSCQSSTKYWCTFPLAINIFSTRLSLDSFTKSLSVSPRLCSSTFTITPTLNALAPSNSSRRVFPLYCDTRIQL